MKYFTILALLVLFGGGVPSRSQAAPVTLTFRGEVSDIVDPFGLVGLLVSVGDPVFLSVRYETSATDFFPGDPTVGAYLSPGWLRVDINSLSFENISSVQGVGLNVLHHGNGDQELVEVFAPPNPLASPTTWPSSLPQFKYTGLSFGVGQNTLPYVLLSSDAPPVSLRLRHADFANGHVFSSTDTETMYEVQFRLVPEPATFGLTLGGIAWVIVRRRLARPRNQ